ncbi:hypothetical protein Q2941_42255 [Bradyrhizobium sp. UFLA05-153]
MAAQTRTLANLGKLPGADPEELQIERSLPHGHVAAALGMIW